MDGLIEPSMPAIPSVIQQMKEMSAATGGTDQGAGKGSFDEDDQIMLGFTGEKKKFSFGSNAAKRSTVAALDNKHLITAMLGPRVNLSAKQKKDIGQAFEAFDVHGTGFMSAVDLRVALRALGFDARKQEIKKMLDMADTGNSGRLCYADFMSIIEMKLGEDDTRDDIMKAFKLFDKDQVGYIAFHNLRQVTDELGEDANDEELAEMLAEADLDDDGALNEEEFYRVLKKSSLY